MPLLIKGEIYSSIYYSKYQGHICHCRSFQMAIYCLGLLSSWCSLHNWHHMNVSNRDALSGCPSGIGCHYLMPRGVRRAFPCRTNNRDFFYKEIYRLFCFPVLLLFALYMKLVIKG